MVRCYETEGGGGAKEMETSISLKVCFRRTLTVFKLLGSPYSSLKLICIDQNQNYHCYCHILSEDLAGRFESIVEVVFTSTTSLTIMHKRL